MPPFRRIRPMQSSESALLVPRAVTEPFGGVGVDAVPNPCSGVHRAHQGLDVSAFRGAVREVRSKIVHPWCAGELGEDLQPPLGVLGTEKDIGFFTRLVSESIGCQPHDVPVESTSVEGSA